MKSPFHLRSSLLLFSLVFIIKFSAAQPIPANDRDIDNVMAKIPAIEQFISVCMNRECVIIDCRSAQDLQLRIRDARWYMRHTFYWLKRAAESQLQHLKSVADEAIMGADRAAYVQKILGWQEFVHKIGAGLLEAASAGSNFKEIVENPKLLEGKSKKEMLELFDNFYEGMKDVEGLAERIAEEQTDKDFPKPIAEMIPAFGGLIDKEKMNDLKSHLSDFYSLMKAANEHSGDFKKILKEGKGLAAIGQITGRFLKSYGDAAIKERQQHVNNILNDVLASKPVQAESFKSLQRMQQRRNKAEDAYLALSRLLIAEKEGGGSLTRCLLRLQSGCSSFDLSYTSRLQFPKEVSVTDFNYVSEEDKLKSWGNALLFFNNRLAEVASLLGHVPALKIPADPLLNMTKNNFTAGEKMEVNFTASSCFSPDSWIGIVQASLVHGDELATGSYVLNGRNPLNGRESGTLNFAAPNDPGSYELRMFDKGTGKEVVSLPFTVGKKKHPMDGVFKEAGKQNYWKVKAWDDGFFIDISSWTPDKPDQEKWLTAMLNTKTSALGKNLIICGCGPTGLAGGSEEKEVVFRIVFSPDMNSFKLQYYKHECDNNCRMKVTAVWDERPEKTQHFIRAFEYQ